jgi:hypothetical protein
VAAALTGDLRTLPLGATLGAAVVAGVRRADSGTPGDVSRTTIAAIALGVAATLSVVKLQGWAFLPWGLVACL